MAVTPVRVRNSTYAKLKAIAEANRMSIVDTIDALADGWSLLTQDQQVRAIRMGRTSDSTATASPKAA